jgi:hypothetical protein
MRLKKAATHGPRSVVNGSQPLASFAAENYWVEDTINTGYVEAIYKFPRRTSGPQFELAANLITQNTVGGDLLTGPPSFFTYQGSARFTVDFGDLNLLSVAFSSPR